jgi:hypothetical protein
MCKNGRGYILENVIDKPTGKRSNNPLGRTPIYKTPEELQVAIDGYFDSLIRKAPMRDGRGNLLSDKDGNILYEDIYSPPTMAGLGLALGISRMTLLRYEDKDALMCEAVTRARARVEAYAESRLYDRDGSGGAQFSLSNNHEGWRKDQPTGGVNLNVFASPDDAAQLLAGIAGLLRAQERNVTEPPALIEAQAKAVE